MFTEAGIEQLIALATVVVGLAAAYAKAFGPYQQTVAQWVIDATAAPKRYKGLINLGVGVVVALGFSAIAAAMMGEWGALPVGTFAGLLASVEASRAHDAAERRGATQG